MQTRLSVARVCIGVDLTRLGRTLSSFGLTPSLKNKRLSMSPILALLGDHHIHILAILEPMVPPDFPIFCRQLGFTLGLGNISNKIWIFLKFGLDYTVSLDHEQVISLIVSSPNFSQPIHTSCIYAKCSTVDRRPLWDSLITLADNYQNIPWLVGGDFNCFLSEDERSGSDTNRRLDMEEFNAAVVVCSLIDLGCSGATHHTWVKNGLFERLDRILVSPSWGDIFGKSVVSHLSRVHSDHVPLLLRASNSIHRKPAAFRFQKMWIRHHSFLDTIRESLGMLLLWYSGHV
ncbi:hypothetical protein DH2020_047902 [Rehmannia glutinosa]|uniref:Endonuclease/exonuclease/phosphatase domain-containing protein n=1 Tax=Rehmannia glutinosa TaxID=99300 RepID=A0ABR0U825_REHGL